MDVLFTFDNTGSMRPCTVEVRRNLRDTAKLLFSEIPDLRIGAIAHGDYCDYNDPYTLKVKDFTNKADSLADFFMGVEGTSGGDGDECYEYVLAEAQMLSWNDDSRGVVVMIGDASPHTQAESARQIAWYGVRKAFELTPSRTGYNWREEAQALECPVYAVQCLGRRGPFYAELARLTGGYHLYLDQFADVLQLLKAAVYKQVGDERLQEFASEIVLNRGLAAMLDTLMGKTVADPTKRYDPVATSRYSSRLAALPDGLVPVEPFRFQKLHVDHDQDIRSFVELSGATFAPGKGYYELTKSVLVQERKEVVVVNRAGDMFTGKEAREIIGLPYGYRGHVSPRDVLGGWRVFIQSTSYTRKLLSGTEFLYEVERR
jgi:hypothetical protein